ALGLLEHPVAGVRRWTARLLGDDRRMSPSLLASLVHLAATDKDPLVRSQLASSCQRWSWAESRLILLKLVARDEDRDDTQIPLLLWWAFERHLRDDRDGVVDSLASSEHQRLPIVRDVILGRV